MAGEVRIDKYLWCVRLYKTRSIATELCRKGKVRVGGEPVKPSREVKTGETYTLHDQGIVKSFRVLAVLNNRVGAKLVSGFLEDLTPQSEYDKLKLLHTGGFEVRLRGTGRPTKRERRIIDRMKDPEE